MALAWFHAEASAAAKGAGACSPQTEQRAQTTQKAARARDAMDRCGTRQCGDKGTAPSEHSKSPRIQQAGRLASAPTEDSPEHGGQARRDSRSGPSSHCTTGTHFPSVWDMLLTGWFAVPAGAARPSHLALSTPPTPARRIQNMT